MRKYFVFFSLSLLCLSSSAFGLSIQDILSNNTAKTNVSSLTDVWGGGTLNTCGTHSLSGTEACIGASQRNNCESKGIYARDYTDEYAIQMLVARKLTEQGGFFCPTQLEGKNKDRSNSWTEAADLTGGNNALCVWLCRPGFTGATCELTESEVTSCDMSLLKRSNYASLARLSSGTNIENDIAMFKFNVDDSCGYHGSQEHDMILAVTGWTPSGHGAFVQQMVWRAERSGWKDMISWSSIYPATNSEKILVCKNGYKPNAANTDCEEINSVICRSQSLCDGWSGFDETIHTFYQTSDDATCYQFRCLEPGTAFASTTNRSCVACTSADVRAGVSPADGTCVHCNIGDVFDEDAVSSGYCTVATAYTKSDMMYGKGQTKNTVDLKQQCWTIVDTEDYVNCVKGIQYQEIVE